MATAATSEHATHLPWFITAPGDVDVLYVITAIALVIGILLIGVLFFWLHSLPERLGHKKLQFEIVAVLALISLFTHMHIFWVIGLLLALVDLPDLMSPLRRIATSTERMADMVQASEGSSEENRDVAVEEKAKQGGSHA